MGLKKFVEYIVRNLVDEPQLVDIQSSDANESLKLEIHVSKKDVGKVVGRKGQTIKALRLISMLTAARAGQKRVQLDVKDDQ